MDVADDVLEGVPASAKRSRPWSPKHLFVHLQKVWMRDGPIADPSQPMAVYCDERLDIALRKFTEMLDNYRAKNREYLERYRNTVRTLSSLPHLGHGTYAFRADDRTQLSSLHANFHTRLLDLLLWLLFVRTNPKEQCQPGAV